MLSHLNTKDVLRALDIFGESKKDNIAVTNKIHFNPSKS